MNLKSSDYGDSKIISKDAKLESISWELNIENPLFSICVGVWVGGRPRKFFHNHQKIRQNLSNLENIIAVRRDDSERSGFILEDHLIFYYVRLATLRKSTFNLFDRSVLDRPIKPCIGQSAECSIWEHQRSSFIGSIRENPEIPPSLWKNDNSGLKMQVLIFLGIQPNHV